MLGDKNCVVLGAGFGDEGKGVVVDWLSEQAIYSDQSTMVQRFSGGPQAGHTVYYKDGYHIFSTYGSGTYRGLPTYISKNCLFNPMSALKEYGVLKKKMTSIPFLYIDLDAIVITPADIIANRNNEPMKANGTCGSGIGTAIEREENNFSLRVADLYTERILKAKYSSILDYYSAKDPRIKDFIHTDIEQFWLAIAEVRESIQFQRTTEKARYEPYHDDGSIPRFIYEGSQGLLLDPEYGVFPNVTRTKVGTQNIYEGLHPNNTKVFLVSRAYTTRHGAGWLNTEGWSDDILIKNNSETNITNKYQGDLRYGLLDLSLLQYVVRRDKFLRENARKIVTVITCMDQMNKFRLINADERVVEFESKERFLSEIYKNVPGELYINTSNKSETIKRIF